MVICLPFPGHPGEKKPVTDKGHAGTRMVKSSAPGDGNFDPARIPAAFSRRAGSAVFAAKSREISTLRGSGVRLSEVRECARKYYSLNLNGRRNLIIKVWLSDKKEGLELMADMLGVTFEHLYNIGNIEVIKNGRNKSRRKRRNNTRQVQSDVIEVAMEAAAGGHVFNSGGKKTTWKTGNGNTKSAASGQAWQALSGL